MLTHRQLFFSHIGQTTANPMSIEVVKAEGSFMYGPDGEKYLDLISGVSVSNVGHANKEVTGAVMDQVGKYMHLMVYGEIIQAPQVKYAELLTSILPDPLKSVYFVNSGSEAVDGALKLARRYTGRPNVLSFRNSYHGGTFGALSVQGSHRYREKFRPLLPGIGFACFNDPGALEMIDKNTGCVIVEPVQAEAGVIVPEEGFLLKLRDRCSETGTLLIFDEVQTGFGRTGRLFSSLRYDVTPDILILAKALGGGMPLGAFISSGEIMSSLSENPALGHITTFGGHPVSCAAGMASLNYIIENNLSEGAIDKGEIFRSLLKHENIVEVRGEGLLLAVKLKSKRMVDHMVSSGPGKGIITDYFLFCDDAFRIAPPLTISLSEIEMAVKTIIEILDEVS